MFSFADIPNLSGKVAIVTGGSAGLGKVTCLELARKDATVYVVGRNPEKARGVIDEITKETGNKKVEFLQADLMDLDSVEVAAKAFLATGLPLHILVNNAGVMGPPFSLSKQGIESQFATNHFAHFLFTMRLMPALQKAAPTSVKIVNLSSIGHKLFASGGINFEGLNDEKAYSAMTRYGETKAANILFTKELSKRLAAKSHHVYVNSCHPGNVQTDLARDFNPVLRWIINTFITVNVQFGTLTQLYLAVSPEIEQGDLRGKYFVPTGVLQEPTAYCSDPANATALWEWTERILAEKGYNFDPSF